MEYGLDIGPGAIRSATGRSGDPSIESVPAIAVAAAESTLDSVELSVDGRLVERDDATYAVGSDAATVADATGTEPRALFSNGVLAVDEFSEPTLATLADTVLPEPDSNSSSTPAQLCYTTPGTLVDTVTDTGADTDTETDTDVDPPAAAHRETVASVFADRECSATPISRGFAVVYDQFAADNYTGLGICLGRQTTSVALAYYGVPVLAFSITRGTDWVVDRAAGETGRAPPQVRRVLETFELDPDAATGPVERALAAALDELVGELADALGAQAAEADVQRGVAVPIAVAGPGAIDGLEFLLGGRFDAAGLPISIRGVRLAEEPEASAARGALAAARDDVDAYEGVTWGGAATSGASGSGSTARASTGDATLSFDGDPGEDETEHDSEHEPPVAADTARADDAIDHLFDRLANRDDEIQALVADLDRLEAALETVSDETPRIDDLDDVETELADVEERTTELEAASDGHADAETVAAIETDLETLSETVTDRTEAVDTALEITDTRVDGVAGRLEEQATRLDAVSGRIEELSTHTASRIDDTETELEDRFGEATAELESDRETLGALEATVERLDEDAATTAEFESLETRVDEFSTELDDVASSVDDVETAVDDVTATVDDVTTTVEETTDAVDGLETDTDEVAAETDRIASEVDAIDDRLPAAELVTRETLAAVEAEHDALEDEFESTRTAVETLSAAVDSTPDESALDAVADDVDSIEGAVDDLETTVSAVASDQAALEERLAEIDANRPDTVSRDEFSALRSELDVQEVSARSPAELVAPLLAGGGGAGVVAGAIVALSVPDAGGLGAGAVGLGLVLVLVAVVAMLVR